MPLLHTDLPYPKRSGKVRDVYDLGDGTLLLVATDRISAFDVVMPDPIPDKGAILTAISSFWFGLLRDVVPNHLLPDQSLPAGHERVLRGRTVRVRKTRVVPIECVARGYLAGSGWNEYRATQTVCGVALPPGLRQCERLPEPIFTPATKADVGHDENVSFDVVERTVGAALASRLRQITLTLYTRAADYARQRGILIADTKFEFGLLEDGSLLLIDEALTPDSSRFWPVDSYEPGREQPSYDKQFLRDWLLRQPWDKAPPAPRLPAEVIEGTRARYVEAYERLTGRRW